MTSVLILLGGAIAPNDLLQYEHIICADSGYLSLEGVGKEGIHLVGDMDSIPPERLEEAASSGAVISRFLSDKDLTDGEIAVRKALSMAPDRLVICGGRRGRLDHVLSGSHLLFLIPSEVRAELRIERDRIYLLRRGRRMTIEKKEGIVSILPARGDCVVSVKGMKWGLENERLDFGSTRGIHNEFRDGEAVIESISGDLFVMVVHEPV